MSDTPKKKVLIVDDLLTNRVMLEDILEETYDVESAQDGSEAISILKDSSDEFSLVLLDIMMPNVDGFGVLDFMKSAGLIGKLPVIVISGDETVETEERALSCGVADFVHKPFDSAVVMRRANNIVELYSYQATLEARVAEQTRELRITNKRLQEQADQIQLFNENTISLLGVMVEYRDIESGEHVNRVKAYTEILALEVQKLYPEIGLTDEDVARITNASALHDLGKIAIPDAVMLKPGRLTEEEFAIMKNHTIYGDELASKVKGAWDDAFGKVVHEICRHHHERYDGRGYPDGLAGEDIPLSAQIVSVADVYDALVTERVYKAAYSTEKAHDMILAGECGVFSPRLMKCFEGVRERFENVARGLDTSTSSYKSGFSA